MAMPQPGVPLCSQEGTWACERVAYQCSCKGHEVPFPTMNNLANYVKAYDRELRDL
ncbi:hypothetical protein SB861_14425 [Paraburkholderia sp. SIMBA_049]